MNPQRDRRAPSHWHLASYAELTNELAITAWSGAVDGRAVDARVATNGLWIVVTNAAGAAIAVRAAFSPGPLTVERTKPVDGGADITVMTTIGLQVCRLRLDPEDGVISCRTELTPSADVDFPSWPRDIVPLGRLRHPPRGTVHTHQRGLRTGLVHCTLDSPGATSFMYLQDLSVLGPFCERTRASAADTVGGDWPDIGFRLPAGGQSLSKADGPVTLGSFHIAFADERPANPARVADQYLRLLGRLYFHIERPSPEYTNWLDHADRARADLEKSPACWTRATGARFLRAYVGDDHPAESMVQLAVLVPLLERQRWSGKADRMAATLCSHLDDFFDERIGSVTRWLPEQEDELTGREPHEHPWVMDSWYLFHPLLNLARIAAWGDEQARRLFLESLPLTMKIANHFDFEWPVFYDIHTLKVIRAESKPGAGGQRDVPGLYAHVMLQAWDLTGEQRYLDEAIAAGRALAGRGFELTYQINNVAFGMEAMIRLFQITGDEQFREIAHVLAACLFDNSGLWQCLYGDAKGRSTFIGVYPLVDAPYTAAYEEAEVAAAALSYLRRAGDDVHPTLGILLPEVVRHTTARLPQYFPCNVAPHALSQSPKTGFIEARLRVPVEDIGDGWEQVGTVGQEVYGVGMAFSTVVRSYVRIESAGVFVYCDYPLEIVSIDERSVRLHVMGDPRLQCLVRVDTGTRRRLPGHVVAGSESGPLQPRTEGATFAEYDLTGGQDLFVTVDPPRRSRAHASAR